LLNLLKYKPLSSKFLKVSNEAADGLNNIVLSGDLSFFINLIIFLNKTLVDDDLTGRGTLAAAYANRGIIKDRKGDYEGALKDYIKSLETDSEAVEGPGLGEKILYMINKPSSIRKRAQYIYEQFLLPCRSLDLNVMDFYYSCFY